MTRPLPEDIMAKIRRDGCIQVERGGRPLPKPRPSAEQRRESQERYTAKLLSLVDQGYELLGVDTGYPSLTITRSARPVGWYQVPRYALPLVQARIRARAQRRPGGT